MSMMVAMSFGLLYKLNRFLAETILKTLYTSLIDPYLSYDIESWHGTYQNNNISKIFVLQKKEIIKLIYHDFLRTKRRGSHVNTDKTHTQSSRYTP